MKNRILQTFFVETQFSKAISWVLFIFLPVIGICIGHEAASPIHLVVPPEQQTSKPPNSAERPLTESLIQNKPVIGEYLSTHLDGLPVSEYRIAFSDNIDGEVHTLFSSYHSDSIDVVCHTPTSVYQRGILYIDTNNDYEFEFKSHIRSCTDVVLNPSNTKLAVAKERSIIIVNLVEGEFFIHEGDLEENEGYGWVDGFLDFRPHLIWSGNHDINAYVYLQVGTIEDVPSPLRFETISSNRADHYIWPGPRSQFPQASWDYQI